jgi:hypothetical protein
VKLAPAAITALALGLRLAGLDRKSVWFDEAVTHADALTPWPRLLDSIAHDVHPPLSYVVIHLWPWVTAGELGLRLPSAVLGALAATMAWAWVRGISSPGEALFTGLLVAVMPLQVDLAQDARMYGLLLLLTASSLWLLDRVLVRPTRARLLAYTLVAAAMLYTHYFAAFILAAEGLGALLTLRSCKGRAVAGALAALVLAGVLFLPWLPVLAGQATSISGDYWIEPPRLATAWITFRDLAAHTPPDEPFRFILRVAYVVQVGLLVAGAAAAWRCPRQRVAICLLVAPISLALAVSVLVAPIYAVRYVSPVGLAFAFLLVRGAGTLRLLPKPASGLWRPVVALACLPPVLSLWFLYFDPGYSRSDLRAAAQVITANRQPDEVVLHLSDFTAVPFTYYQVAKPEQVLQTDERSELCDALRGHAGGWIITSYAPDNEDHRLAAEAGIATPTYAGSLIQEPPRRLLGASVFHLHGPCNV